MTWAAWIAGFGGAITGLLASWLGALVFSGRGWGVFPLLFAGLFGGFAAGVLAAGQPTRARSAVAGLSSLAAVVLFLFAVVLLLAPGH